MSAANSNIQLTELDFDNIKNNLKNYLRDQDILKDADYEGSVLSTVLDVLAYNTHYNAYYLNMLANELFLDTATKRNSVVSKAKLLGYTPSSIHSCIANIDLYFQGLSTNSIYIPKYTKFISENIDNIYYTFVTTDDYYATASNNEILIKGIEILEGEPVSIRSIYSKSLNPTSTFQIPDTNIDLNTLEVRVQKSTTNLSFETYQKSGAISTIGPESLVYFIEENSEGFYQIIFGDGIIGKALSDGNVVVLTYIVSSGIECVGAKEFKLISTLPMTYTNSDIIPVANTVPAFGGKDRESIDSIKFTAPKFYEGQGRAVTYKDYILALQNNEYNFSFDAVNVWGGQDNDPPIYGQVFLCMKPTGGFNLTLAQKKTIMEKMISPISVVTVNPTIVDPDYNYIKITCDVLYDSNKTLYSQQQIQEIVRKAILEFCNDTLNTFESTFSLPNLMYKIQTSDPSIISNDTKFVVQKKFFPNLQVATNYELKYGFPLERGVLSSGISSYPSMSFYNKTSDIQTITSVYIEELPTALGGIDYITVTIPGYDYTSEPTIEIIGDGTGATARASIVNGTIQKIVLENAGNNYSYATVSITGGGGNGAQAMAIIAGRYGNIRSIYYNDKSQKVVLNSNVGTVDYELGTITLDQFNPFNVDNTFGELSISAKPKTTIISSAKNRLLTIDPFDSTSITVKVTRK